MTEETVGAAPTEAQNCRAKGQAKMRWSGVSSGAEQIGHPALADSTMCLRSRTSLVCIRAWTRSQVKNRTRLGHSLPRRSRRTVLSLHRSGRVGRSGKITIDADQTKHLWPVKMSAASVFVNSRGSANIDYGLWTLGFLVARIHGGSTMHFQTEQ